ncbi:MAG: hypothetical protein ACTHJW_08890 [Streptosporangiaceae bacterium]
MIGARRPRLLATLLGSAAMTIGLVLLPAAPGSLAAGSAPGPSQPPSPSASPSPSTSPSPSPSPSHTKTRTPRPSPRPSKSRHPRPRHKRHGTTVTGPRMFNPARHRHFAARSTVTVSQTKNLVNEMVHVSWTGFTPSSDVLYDQSVTDYPVMVVECNSASPRRLKQCYGGDNGGVQGAFGPSGPMNTAYATTAKSGTGQLDIQVLTLAENQFLGCSIHHRCSLVIVPSQGGDTLSVPVNCGDHALDPAGTDLGQFAFSSETGHCSWAKRIVVPLSFAPAPDNCQLKKANFAAIGSPMLLRAMNQWRAGLCAGSNPIALTFNAAITEPEAIADLPSGLGDIALTTRPGPAHINSNKTYTYAPVAVSAVAIAYWVDNPTTGQPVRNLKFDPLLVTKLLTQSYNFDNDGCAHGTRHNKQIGCDAAVDGNPLSLFKDPQFKQLNPGVPGPFGGGASFQVPTVESGHSDMTWEVTRWIANNHAAQSFMGGHFDRFAMHVNTDYLGITYPLDSFTGQDSYPVIAHKYSPVFPLSLVASYQVQNWEPGTFWEKDQFGNFPRDPIEIPGERALFAILDQGDAAAFRFPTARILNHSGHYVAPSDKTMAAALPAMVRTGKNHVTHQINYNKAAKDAYPLTMVIYAMVPTSHVKQAKADAIARFLQFVAGPGQTPGLQPGHLPPGYLPLPASLRAQTMRAAQLVLHQKGNSLHPKPNASQSPVSPAPTPSPSRTRLGEGVVTVRQAAQTSGPIRYALPILLIVGGAATLGGASSLMYGSAMALTERARRLRRLRLVRRNKQ